MAAGLIAFIATLICYISLPLEAIPMQPVATSISNQSDAATAPVMKSCINEISGGEFKPAAACKNGRGLPGCCIARVHCDYNTSHIDRTLYGPRGYRESCDNSYVCCPVQFALPFFINGPAQDDQDFIDASNDSTSS